MHPLVQRQRRSWWLIGGTSAVLAILGYYVYDHWQRIQVFPRDTRRALRLALHAERKGASRLAENYFHDALSSSIQLAGHDSVLVRDIAAACLC